MRYKIWSLLAICVILRFCCLISKNSYYVADEYWQSLEVAHRLIFGYGYLTWEWVYAIRSYIYVSWIALLYHILKVFNLDSVENLTSLPLIIQGIFSAIADTYFILWAYKVSTKRQAYWSVWCYMTNVFLAYCATRTLTNTIETNLTCIALYYYPWSKREIGNVKYFWLVCLACVIKPTAFVIWAPLCFFALKEAKNPIKLFFIKYIPVGLIVLSLATLLDSYMYGKWVLTWWNFFIFNIMYKANTFYSVQSVYWYFIIGLPVVLGPCIVPFYIAMSSKLRSTMSTDPTFNKIASTVTFALIVYSFIPHKEFRFILPLCPLMVFIASYPMQRWTSTVQKIHSYLIALTLLLVSAHAFYFLSHYHQVATVRVMDYLRSPKNNLLFLMPCHLTPLYSHLHVNITARFLRCDPDFTNNPEYVEESVKFYNDPMLWLEEEYPNPYAKTNPTHIICFDILVPRISRFLKTRGYRNSTQLYHGTFVPPKVGNYLLIYQRTNVT